MHGVHEQAVAKWSWGEVSSKIAKGSTLYWVSLTLALLSHLCLVVGKQVQATKHWSKTPLVSPFVVPTKCGPGKNTFGMHVFVRSYDEVAPLMFAAVHLTPNLSCRRFSLYSTLSPSSHLHSFSSWTCRMPLWLSGHEQIRVFYTPLDQFTRVFTLCCQDWRLAMDCQ